MKNQTANEMASRWRLSRSVCSDHLLLFLPCHFGSQLPNTPGSSPLRHLFYSFSFVHTYRYRGPLMTRLFRLCCLDDDVPRGILFPHCVSTIPIEFSFACGLRKVGSPFGDAAGEEVRAATIRNGAKNRQAQYAGGNLGGLLLCMSLACSPSAS